MKKYFTSTSNSLSFSNQLFKHFKKTANSFRVGMGFLVLVLAMMLISTSTKGQQFWKIDGTTATWTGAVWGTSVAGPFTTAYSTTTPVRFTATSLASFATTTVNNITVDPGITVTVTASGTLTCTAVRTFDIGAGSTLTWQGQSWSTSASSFGVIKTGTGTWDIGAQSNTLNATNFGFTLNAGTVIVGGNNSFGGTTSLLTINGGTIQSSGTRLYPNNITLGGNHTHTGTGNATFSGTVGLGASTRTITNSTTSGSRIYSGIISGSGLTFDGTGSGQIYIGNAGNTFTGTITINGGEVGFVSNGAFSDAINTIVLNGGRLSAATTAGAASSYTLASTHGIQVGATAGTSISPVSGGTLTYDGVISDLSGNTGILGKNGSGTLSLGGVSTYTGATSINNGTIQLTTGSNRLPTTTDLTLGQAVSANVGKFDLNGQSQQIASLNSTTGTNASAANNNTITSTSAATLTVNGGGNYGDGTDANSGIITGSIALTKSGIGILTLGDANTYSGATTISGGILRLGATGVIPDASNVILDGGTISTGAANGFSETIGTLNLTASTSSTIASGTGNHSLTFANSSALSPWGSSASLTITGWTGSAGSSGTNGKIFIGSNSTGLTSAQLAKISFSGFSGTATILSTGEIVPTAPTPTITGTATATPFTTTYGTASASQAFSVSGSNLTTNLIATAPTGFEVSSDGITYGSTATFTQSSGTASGSLRVRLAANAAVTGSYNSQNIVLSSTGATAVNITTASSGNVVTPKALTITGVIANNKVYDGNTTATIQGTPAYVGLVNSEAFSITGTATASFANATVENGKTVTVSGYIAPSPNYSLTQPTGLTANITQKSLTVTGATAANKIYDGNTDAVISGGTLVGVVSPDNVSVSGNGTFASASVANGISVTTSLVLGSTNAGNYLLIQPTGILANITQKSVTITGLTANNKVFDGTTTATVSGTAILNGVIVGEEANVTLAGTPTAVFVQSAVGTGIAVTVTGYSLTGSGSGNYSVSQPAGLSADITSSPPPVINSVLTASATYGVVSTSYFITATNSPTSFNATGLPTGLTINTTTGEISGTPTAIAGSPFSVTISATNNGGTGTATLVYTITPKTLTITTPSVPNKVYDRTNAATISGTLSGVVNSDVVSLNGTGTFSQIGVGSNLAVTSTATLSGADAAKYSLTQPTGLTADITTKSLTVTNAVASNRVYNGITTATITGATLNGIVNPDVVTVTGNGSFASSDVANNIEVTTALTLGGADVANYTITQPTGLTANITAKSLTITNPIAQSKVYNGNTNAIITGTLSGVISPDLVTLSGTGTFSSSTVGNGIVVTSTSTIVGGDEGNYSLTQPTGLTANITAKPLTITGLTANNKVFDGTTTATLSGTAVLNGVIGTDNVTLTGTPVATFAQSSAGNGITVTVTEYSLTGSESGNYSVSQPSGLTANISVPSPVINSALTATATYGVASTSYFITATNSPTSFNATGLPTGLTINTTTGEILGTPTAIAGSPFSVTISATNNGGTGTATLVYTITPKTLTVTTPSVPNKVYDRTNAATISGTLSGIVGADDVSLNGTGTFSQIGVGSGLAVTSTSTLSGADASKYTLTQPTGLTANITAKSLTVSGVTSRNKYFDGTTIATLLGIPALNGIITGDVVTLGGITLANFVQSAVGSGIAVTVSGYTISGTSVANYSLTQPTGLIANITAAPTLTEVILPQYIQGVNGTNSNRIPFAYRASVNGLSPNTAYRYYNGVELTTASLNSAGAGNNIFPSTIQTNSFTYSTGPSLSSVGNYGTFTTDATGAYSGWFIIAPSGNATRFVPGTNLYTRIALIDEAATYSSTVISSTNTIKVINLVNAAGANNGTGLRGNSGATDKNFVFVYDNTSGTGRPLSGTFVENDGAAEVTSFATFYTSNVDAVSGAYGVVIPNTNANGVRRIEQRDFSAGAIVGCAATDDDGLWASGANTVNPTGGTTPIVITVNDAPLNTCVVTNTAPTIVLDVNSTTNYIDGGANTNITGSYSVSSVINDPTDPTQTLGISFTIGDAETAVGSLTVTTTSSNTGVVPNANLNFTGTGASRNLKITPVGVGYSTITVLVNDGTLTSSFTVNFAASAASANVTTTRFHTGTSDASTAQVIDNNLMFVGDDENQALRLYNRQNSGLPVNSFDFTTSFGLTDASGGGVLREVDIEASAKVGNRIYWLGSHSNSSDGSNRPNRSRFFATDIAGAGNATTLSYVGRYDNLKTELLAWDANNGHGLGANFLGLAASSATGIAPEISNGSGFNIEGFEIAPNNSTAYICFRAPLQTTTTRTKALIIPLTNFADLVGGNPTTTTATFGNPIQLDLGGRAIREMKRNSNGEYLIIAGPHDGSTGIAPKDFRFYTWTGNAADAPVLRDANLTALNSGGSVESIVDLPSSLSANSSIQVLIDNGDAVYYNDGTSAKDLTTNNFKKFRSEIINLGNPVLPVTTITSIATGDWESTTTWNLGRVPQAGDLVVIDQNHTVTLNTTVTVSIKNLKYNGTGTLKFNSTNSKLQTGL